MKSMAAIWHLKIQHEFFKNKTCRGIEMDILPETAVLLNRRGWIIRPVNWGEWDLITFSGIEPTEDDKISVEVTAMDPLLSYITEWEGLKMEQCYWLELNGTEGMVLLSNVNTQKHIEKSRPGIIIRMDFIPGRRKMGDNGILENEIVFRALELHWEYIFLLRDERTERTLLLEDTTKQIAFGEMIKTTFLGKTALSCKSMDKIPLRENPTSILRLREMFTSGKQNLFNRLPLPKPGVFVDKYADTIKQVIYV